MSVLPLPEDRRTDLEGGLELEIFDGWKHRLRNNGWDLPLPIGMVVEWQNNEGMLGGAFTLKEGSARIQRIGGRDALVLEPGTTLEYSHPLLSSSKEHTVSGLVYRSGKWQSYEAESCLSSGAITLHSSTEPLVITNFRYYNWKQEAAEKAYDAETDIVRLPVADQQKHGLVSVFLPMIL